MYKTEINSPLGILTLTSDGEHLTGLFIENQKYFLNGMTNLIEKDSLEIFNKTKTWLEKYFKGENPSINELKLLPRGTEFQKVVWKHLLTVPYGKTITYKELGKIVAKKLGKNNMSAQAIGTAVGHNPISIIIPCHRVIGTDGTLTGYAGGIEKKAYLLMLEKRESMIDKVGGVILKDNKILVQRKNNNREECIIPGGKREGKEIDFETLKRELEEELSVELIKAEYMGTYQDIVVFSKKPLQVITYIATIKGEIKCNNEIKEAIWIDRNYKKQGIKVGSILGEYVIPELIKRNLM